MSETDIYKQREPMPMGKKPDKKNKHRRRRTSPQRAFDDKSRKRRSKNSGLRRILHLSRKSENEKVIWTVFGIGMFFIIVLIALWQFFIQEKLIREEESQNDYMEYQPSIPRHGDEAILERAPVQTAEEQSAME